MDERAWVQTDGRCLDCERLGIAGLEHGGSAYGGPPEFGMHARCVRVCLPSVIV